MGQARTGYLPRLSLDGNFTATVHHYDGVERWNFSVLPQLVQVVYGGGAVRAAYRQAELGYDIALCDEEKVDLIFTTGGTGPAPRDLTPEAMVGVIEKELPGFGELMRKISLEKVPTAILSRQSAGTRGRTLIVNLPGKPSSINVCLDAVFPAIPYCLDLMEAGRIDTDPAVCAAFRPA